MTVEATTANSITLSWTALDSADRYKLYYTTDGQNFLPVLPPTGYSTFTRKDTRRSADACSWMHVR